jgi:hypothetical protein
VVSASQQPSYLSLSKHFFHSKYLLFKEDEVREEVVRVYGLFTKKKFFSPPGLIARAERDQS